MDFFSAYFRHNVTPAIIAGPCVIEDRDMALRHAELLSEAMTGLSWIWKSSYDKANRTSIHSFRGVGIERGLGILAEIKEQFGIPVLTDVHSPAEATLAAEVVDMIQVPAFLCRQTDLLVAAGQTQKPVNLKKGQFLSGQQMAYAAEKVATTGNKQITLTERGSSFGQGNLVVDFRDIVDMKALSYPVIFDATHSVQLPVAEASTRGQRQFVEPLAAAALAVGVHGLFFEVHENPAKALSDKETQIPLADFRPMLDRLFS